MVFIVLTISFLFLLELTYFRIATRFNIIDKPNLRSSHSKVTIRGGGILFPLSFCLGLFIFQPHALYLALGVFLIAAVSFLDDIFTLKNTTRISVHLISVGLIVYQLHINSSFLKTFYAQYPVIFILSMALAFISIIGIINVCNFMDGINGILGLYFLVNISCLYYWQLHQAHVIFKNEVWQMLLSSLLIFGIFNFRQKAKAFAGDVGSISLALIMCFVLCIIMIDTQSFKWILFLSVYGIDAVGTIFCRLIRKENIFEAHRSHFYQYLANQKKMPHMLISILYALLQFIINIFLIIENSGFLAFAGFLIMLIAYIILRIQLEGKKVLFHEYSF